MIAIAKPSSPSISRMSKTNDQQASNHDQFLVLLPAIRRHARVAFRHQATEAREEAISAAIAHAWAAFVRLVELGRSEIAYASPLASYAVAHVREGRSVGSRLNARDVTSTRCQRRHGVQIESLTQVDQGGDWHEIVVEDRRTSPADIAVMRIDFEAWLNSLPPRQREIAEVLALGEATQTVARRFGLTPGRVSQIRQKLHRAWCSFQGDGEPATVLTVPCA